MLRIFLSEYLCGGACRGTDAPASLLREGRAMLVAIAADFARLPGIAVVSTWDRRLGPSPLPGESLLIDDPVAEATAFDRLIDACDASYVIAPELEGTLLDRCTRAAAARSRSLNVAPEGVQLCGDKLALARWLEEAGVPTIPTTPLPATGDHSGWTSLADAWREAGWAGPVSPDAGELPLPLVLKPRFGAGSQKTFLVRTAAERNLAAALFGPGEGWTAGIAQPWIDGQACSVAAWCDGRGNSHVAPIAAQKLSNDGRCTYLGGSIPADVPCPAAITDLVRRTLAIIPGLRGYVGLDIIVPAADRVRPLLVEINPRLTTSYLGYRQLSRDNLAKWIVEPDQAAGPRWKTGEVTFDAAGDHCKSRQ